MRVRTKDGRTTSWTRESAQSDQWTARNDQWSTDFGGREMGPTRLVRERETPTCHKIEAWLEQNCHMGAMEKGRLIAMIELSLAPWSEDVRRLGAKKMVAILGRSRWRGAVKFKPCGV